MVGIVDTLIESAERKHKDAKRNVSLSEGIKEYLKSFPRPLLLRLFHVARLKAREKGAYFWRAMKAETWYLLATNWRDD